MAFVLTKNVLADHKGLSISLQKSSKVRTSVGYSKISIEKEVLIELRIFKIIIAVCGSLKQLYLQGS